MNMLKTLLILSTCIVISMSAIIPHKLRAHRNSNVHSRNCFFTPAQCALNNFPQSEKLQPVLQVFENASLDTIYSNLKFNRPSFFDYRK